MSSILSAAWNNISRADSTNAEEITRSLAKYSSSILSIATTVISSRHSSWSVIANVPVTASQALETFTIRSPGVNPVVKLIVTVLVP